MKGDWGLVFKTFGEVIWDLIRGKQEPAPTAPETRPVLVSPYSFPQCFSYIYDLLLESQRAGQGWNIIKRDEVSGRIVAQMQWVEDFGPHFKPLDRQIVLTADLYPRDEGDTVIELHWDIHSPLNKAGVNEVKDAIEREIKLNLETEIKRI